MEKRVGGEEAISMSRGLVGHVDPKWVAVWR